MRRRASLPDRFRRHPRATARRRLLPAPPCRAAWLTAYTFCDHCRPVLFLRDHKSVWGDYVDERRPWCEWRLVFVAGGLERREPVRVETRTLVAEQLRKEGIEVLDDNDRLARWHFGRLEGRER